jgi:hypothetical protein
MLGFKHGADYSTIGKSRFAAQRDFRSADDQGNTKLSAITMATKKPATARTNAIFSISCM